MPDNLHLYAGTAFTTIHGMRCHTLLLPRRSMETK